VLRKQTQVQRVQDRAHAGHGVIELEVPVIVEGEGRHPIARLDAEPLQRARKTVDARHQLGIGHAVNALLAFGDNLLLLVQALHSPEHMLKRELVVLHQPFHYAHLHHIEFEEKAWKGRW